MDNKYKSMNFLLLLLSLFLGSCGLLPKSKVDPNDPNSSFIYGYIDISQMKSQFQWINLRNLKDEDDNWHTYTNKQGIFYHPAIKPANYRATAFGGWNSDSLFEQQNATAFHFDKNKNNELSINTTKPGFRYMGAYKLVIKGKGFELRPIKGPSKKKILKMILADMKQKQIDRSFPRQIKMIKNRI